MPFWRAPLLGKRCWGRCEGCWGRVKGAGVSEGVGAGDAYL